MTVGRTAAQDESHVGGDRKRVGEPRKLRFVVAARVPTGEGYCRYSHRNRNRETTTRACV